MILQKKESMKIDLDILPEELMPLARHAQEFMQVRNLYRAAIKEVSTKLEILDDEFSAKHSYNPIHHMECRVKSYQSLVNKVERLGLTLDEDIFSKIYDIGGIRVICKYTSDIYQIRDMLLRQTDFTLFQEKDYIKNPKESGYRSLHLIVHVPVCFSETTEIVPIEIQIRTIVMDTWASLDHELKYKRENSPLSEDAAEALKICAEEMHSIDILMEQIHNEDDLQKIPHLY